MKQETLARTIIETMIHKFFRDMENDPDRSIRNIIDFGINFARGRFQKEFFQILQKMLENEQSAYYTLVKQLVANTDHQKLQTFGMNVGFQACTLGADIIRKNESAWNFNIPWAYYLMLGEEGLPIPYLDKIISEGKSMGTYVYFLAQAGTLTEEHVRLFQRHKSCAFILLTTSEAILGELMTWLTDVSNLLILVENQPDKMEETTDELGKHGFLYGIYETCDPQNQELLWDPSHLEQIASTKAVFYVLMPKWPFNFEEDLQRRKAVMQIRNQQEYPFIMADFISDIQKIDRVISNDSCAVAFDAEGYIYTDTGKWQDTPYNIKNKNLFEILEKVTQKRQES